MAPANPYAPPQAPPAATTAPRERWRTRTARGLRLYAFSYCASVAFAAVILALKTFRTVAPHAGASPVTTVLFQVPVGLAAACDLCGAAAFFLTIPRSRSRTRVSSVLGACLGPLYWPSVLLLAFAKGDVESGLFVGFAGARLLVLLFCLTAMGVARDVDARAEVPRLLRAAWWQGAAIALIVLDRVTAGDAGASSLHRAVSAVGGGLGAAAFLFFGVPSLLRLARRLME